MIGYILYVNQFCKIHVFILFSSNNIKVRTKKKRSDFKQKDIKEVLDYDDFF